MSDVRPNIDSKGVPFCSLQKCPSYDGKRCRETGHRPYDICEPAVIDLSAKVIAAAKPRDFTVTGRFLDECERLARGTIDAQADVRDPKAGHNILIVPAEAQLALVQKIRELIQLANNAASLVSEAFDWPAWSSDSAIAAKEAAEEALERLRKAGVL